MINSFRRQEDELPFLVRPSSKATPFSLVRWWRSLPRLKRHFLSLLVILAVVGLVYTMGAVPGTEERATSNEVKAEALQAAVADARNHAGAGEAREGGGAGGEGAGGEGAGGGAGGGGGEREDVVERPSNGEEQDKGERGIPVFTGPTNDRQRAVRDAFRHAWKGYKAYAWGHDTLKPISKGWSEWFGTGLTIVDSIDTAIIMDLKEEVAEATAWIRDSLTFSRSGYVNLFETTIRMLGGLLSAYHLTGDKMFVDRSVDLADRLSGAWSSGSKVPFSDVNLKTKEGKGPNWGAESSLSEVTTLQLEFRDLSRVTGDDKWEKLAFSVSEHVHALGCKDGLCDMFISAKTGQFKKDTTITLGARSDSYYEYLLKQYLQTGKSIGWLLSDYEESMRGVHDKLVKHSRPGNLTFVGELIGGSTFSPKMDHLVCFLAGTLALGHASAGQPSQHLSTAHGVAAACEAMYHNPTGLGPEIAHYNWQEGSEQDLYIKPLDAHCLLRPEAIEAWFYLYRLTGEKKYQEWGWNAFQAIDKYARVTNGYSSVSSVKKIPVTYKDLMESFFLAETLKYLYLLLADDQTMIPLDRYVFNTEGHPLPIYDH